MTDDSHHGWEKRAPAGQLSDVSHLAAVAESLGVAEGRLADWVDAGLVRCSQDGDAGGDIHIELTDATLLRSLCGIRGSGPKPQKFRRTLDRLRDWLPQPPEPRRSLTLVDRNGPLLVRLADGALADPSGQFRFRFNPGVDASPAGRIGPRPPETPEAWHEQGVRQECEDKLAEAVVSYTRALLLGGPDVQVVYDLAYALAELGLISEATERYRQVIELDPLRQDAWVNLGDLLLTDEKFDEAVAAFRRALDLDPDDAAAHYNLAEALESDGQPRAAALHWQAFLALSDTGGEHLAYARSRICKNGNGE